MHALVAKYWKLVQSGLENATDTEIVRALSGAEVLSETYRLSLPQLDGPLVVEGVGGDVMAPLNREAFCLDLFAR